MKFIKFIAILTIALIALLLYFANLPDQIVLKVRGHEIFCEIADTPDERALGLMYRKSLGKNEGMLFKYTNEEERNFHMANCNFPIAIAFTDKDGFIVSITEMTLEPNKSYSSIKPAMFAVEMNKGWFSERGIQVGDKIEGVHNTFKGSARNN